VRLIESPDSVDCTGIVLAYPTPHDAITPDEVVVYYKTTSCDRESLSADCGKIMSVSKQIKEGALMGK
jgi:hypothetical protein